MRNVYKNVRDSGLVTLYVSGHHLPQREVEENRNMFLVRIMARK
jgi:hypothetical protein